MSIQPDSPPPPPPPPRPCPACGQPISPADARCRSCGADLGGPPGQMRSLRRDPKGVEAADFLVPRNVSTWSLLCCYVGLIGLCLPLVGFFVSVFAILCGVIALNTRRRDGSYGAVTSDVRTVIGLILGTLGALIWGFVWLKIVYP